MRFKTVRRKENLVSQKKIGGGGGRVTMHFSEIIKLQFRKKCHTLLYILALFGNIVASLSLKNAWLRPIFFLDSNSPY